MQKDNTFNRVKFNNEFASREVEDAGRALRLSFRYVTNC